jgi:hypothetical protein
VLVVPVGAEALGDELDDLPVGLGFAEGFEGFVDALDSRSVLVKVPSFSSEGEAGRMTSAYCAVTERLTSWTTRKSSLRRAISTSLALASEVMVSSPLM